MLINEVTIIEAAAKQTVAIYPGRFHLFHKGHKYVYDFLKKKYGTAFIVTSNKQEEGSPFSFEEKKQMMMLTGVPEEAIVYDSAPLSAKSVLDRLDPDTTALVLGVGEKDMTGSNTRFNPGLKQNGEPTYYQHNKDTRETFDKHGYLEVVPTLTFDILGSPASSASQLRQQYATLDDATAKQFMIELFGKFDAGVMAMLDEKLGRNNQ